MNPSQTQSTARLDQQSLDYRFLRQEGMRHLQQMADAGMLWSDFNIHDPGITILEQVCYAITDLTYRIAYRIPDLLASGSMDANESFYSPARIMTTHPVTIEDLRKLVLDVDGVKNVWIEKVDSPRVPLRYHEGRQEILLQSESVDTEPIRLKGLYRVLIETSEAANIDGTVVKYLASRRLHANRPLCEDFEEIRILSKKAIKLNTRIEIGPVDDTEALLSMIYQKISNYFSPWIPFNSLESLRKNGTPVDRIFDGPRLERGFLDTEAVRQAKRRTAVYTSDLIHAIMDVEGVRAVRDINIELGAERDDWSLKLPGDSIPVLDLQNSDITLERNRLVAGVDTEKARKMYFNRLEQTKVYRKLDPAERDVMPPPGRDRNVASYHSIQHQFPSCYGIGDAGLPASAGTLRKGQARQLKAYLLFFDQLLSNHFAQLAHVNDLFSFNSRTTDTYFNQGVPDNGLALKDIYMQDQDIDSDILPAIMKDLMKYADHAERKNRFLDHLMARFAEQFTDYSLFLFERKSGEITPADETSGSEQDHRKPEPAEKMIRDKQAFLQQYPDFSSARGTGFNYLQPVSPKNVSNVSGLEKRIRLKLGLEESWQEDFYLVEHILLRPMPEDLQQQIPFLTQAHARDPYSLQLSFIFPTEWDVRLPAPDYKNMTNEEKKFAREKFELKKAHFRQFVEQVVREETPAHLSPYVHWLSKDAMTRFEDVYASWIEKRRQYWTA